MNSTLLVNKIYSIQNQYKNLLSSLLPKIKSSTLLQALDEINLFWLRNIHSIQLYLKNVFSSQDSYVFTASTFIDFDDSEHIPFLLIGKQHILDDPLSKFAELYSTMPDGKDKECLYEQIKLTAEDNIKILDNLNLRILILPLDLLSQSDIHDTSIKSSENFFISLFDGIETLDDYFTKCNSIDDIEKYSSENILNKIMLTDEDNMSLPFKQRFKLAVSNSKFVINSEQSDAYNFFINVFSYLQQAIHIVVLCIEYGCVPYIRSLVSVNYILIVANHLTNDYDHVKNFMYRMCVGFAVHKSCDKEQFDKIGIDEFLKEMQTYDFNRKLFDKLESQGITQDTFLQHSIGQIVNNQLQELYNYITGNQ
ncbi:MAG: hypothetical protein HDT44_02725 [Ruminococcaceae bacterium]|nr:hypothetical protein [Oscillospiraceae bacterium]